jgi:prefoldin beta subunit
MADLQAKMQALSEEFTKLQQGLFFLALCVTSELAHRILDLQDTVQSRQRLEAQKQENLGVQKVGPPLTSREHRRQGLTFPLGILAVEG